MNTQTQTLTETITRLSQYHRWLTTMEGEHPSTKQVAEDIKTAVDELKHTLAEQERDND